MPIVAPDERTQLEQVDEAIEKLIEAFRAEAENVDPGQVQLLVRTAKRLAYRLSDDLPPSLDPEAGAEIRRILLGGLRKIEETDETRPLDILDDLVVRAESIRHIVRDTLDENLGCDPTDAQALSKLLVAWLPGVTKKQIAELLDVEVRTLHRWLHQETAAPPRLYVIVRLVALLRFAWTSEGVLAWFRRSRRDLDDKQPVDVLDNPAYEQKLLAGAREGRAQHGA